MFLKMEKVMKKEMESPPQFIKEKPWKTQKKRKKRWSGNQRMSSGVG